MTAFVITGSIVLGCFGLAVWGMRCLAKWIIKICDEDQYFDDDGRNLTGG